MIYVGGDELRFGGGGVAFVVGCAASSVVGGGGVAFVAGDVGRGRFAGCFEVEGRGEKKCSILLCRASAFFSCSSCL